MSSQVVTIFGHLVKTDRFGEHYVQIDDTTYHIRHMIERDCYIIRSMTPTELSTGERKVMKIEINIDPRLLDPDDIPKGGTYMHAALTQAILRLQPQIAAKQREITGEDWFERNEAIDRKIMEDALMRKQLEEERRQAQLKAAQEKQAREREALEAIPGYGMF